VPSVPDLVIGECSSGECNTFACDRSPLTYSTLTNQFFTPFLTTFPLYPFFSSALSSSFSSYFLASAVTTACCLLKSTSTFLTHGKVSSALRRLGGQPIGQVIPLTMTVTFLVDSVYWAAACKDQKNTRPAMATKLKR